MMINKKFAFLIFAFLILLIPYNCSLFTDKPKSAFEDNEKDNDTANPGFIKTIDSIGDVGHNTSIAINGSNIYISYLNSTNSDLKFAKSTDSGATWLAGNIKTVDSAGSVGFYSSIAVDGTNVYISYLDASNNDLKFAKSTDSGATWLAGNIKTVDSAGIVGLYSWIAIDGSNVYISYLDGTNADLKIAKSTDGGATWLAGNIKTVDSAGDVGWYTSIAVDGANVYISYFDDTNDDLKLAKSTDSGATWLAGNIKTVDSAGYVGSYTSITVDSSNIYISYIDLTNYDLKFARSTDSGATWLAGNIKTVDSAGSVGYYTSIAVDGANVYISYFDDTNDDLKLAKSTDSGATWLAGNIKTVDSAESVGESTSIAVDGTNIYISYYDDTNDDLKLAKSTDSGATW